MVMVISGCQGTPSPSANLPPSESDLNVLGPIHLCESKTTSLSRWKDLKIQRSPWGTGEEFHLKKPNSSPSQHQWLFFNDDDILVGAVVGYPDGLNLEPYPILRLTLSQLPPSREFFLNTALLLRGTQPETATIHRTGDITSTTQYVIRQKPDNYGDVLLVVVVIDPYEQLLDGFQSKFIPQISPQKSPSPQTPPPPSPPDTQFLASQQFARGEMALFESCGEGKTDIAIDAYGQVIHLGLKDSARLAEAHHRLGLALRNKGRLSEAQAELELALSIRPHAPGVLNSLGTVFARLGKSTQAVESFERAIALKPNYARARYNLAETYEAINPKRAMEEYETYLALVEDIPEESIRAALARDRIQKLQR